MLTVAIPSSSSITELGKPWRLMHGNATCQGLRSRALRICLFFYFSLGALASTAQKHESYSADLDALRQILQKTPSYKDQIAGKKKAVFDALFEQLKKDPIADIEDHQYFHHLARLFFPIRDNHLGFYQVVDKKDYADRDAYERHINSPSFLHFPKSKLDIDSLTSALALVPPASTEGIYHLDTFLTIGMHKLRDKEYEGIVLSSKIRVWGHPVWEKGQVVCHLYEYMPGFFKAIYAHPVTKNLILFPNEKIRNSSIVNARFYGYFGGKNYSKTQGQTDHAQLPAGMPDFQFKDLETGIQYLQLRQFFADPSDMQRSKAFLDSIKRLLTAPDLILDLRNNQGGAKKVSKGYLRLMREYVKKGRVHVLTNNATMSQGEIFLLQLMRLPQVRSLGQTTNGTLMYGNNYGRGEKLPSQAFEVYITDLRSRNRLMRYEVFGVDPDILLGVDRDWIEQAIALIRHD